MQQMTLDYDGQTLNLQAGGYRVLDGYYPRAGTDDVTPVVETIDLWVSGTNGADLDSKIQALTKALTYAKRNQNGAGGAYFNYAVDESATLARSRILGGVVTYNEALTRNRKFTRAHAALTIERQPFFEEALTQLPLTNLNGSNNTAGLKVFSCNDGTGSVPNKRCNYVEINGPNVKGDLPAAVRLELTNTYASEHKLGNIWIGHGWQPSANLITCLEAESAAGKTGTGDGSSSGGQYVLQALSAGSVAQFKWTLSAAQLTAANGEWFHALPRLMIGNMTNYQFQLKIVSEDQTVWESGWAAPDVNYALAIRDLFTFRLPPWLAKTSAPAALDLVLEVVAAQSINLYLDCLFLLPASHWQFVSRGFVTINQNDRVILDGLEGLYYRDTGSGSGRVGLPKPAGTPILLEPGKTQRLHFLMHSWTGNIAEIGRSLSVKAYYRPRRRTI